MKKELFLGLSAALLANPLHAGNHSGLQNITPELLTVNDAERLGNKVSITSENIEVLKKFFSELQNIELLHSFGDYSLSDIGLYQVKDINAQYKFDVKYTLENKFKTTSLYFPAIYSEGEPIQILPLYFDGNINDLVSFKISEQLKKLPSNVLSTIFPLEQRLTLHTTSTNEESLFIVMEPENDESYEFIRSIFDKDGNIKPQFSKYNISIALAPINYFSEEHSLQLSSLLKEYTKLGGDPKIFINYIIDRDEAMTNIKSKYFKKYENGFAEDFVIDMYKETDSKLTTITEAFITHLIRFVENKSDKDLVHLIKDEQAALEKLMKANYISEPIIIYRNNIISSDFFPTTRETVLTLSLPK